MTGSLTCALCMDTPVPEGRRCSLCKRSQAEKSDRDLEAEEQMRQARAEVARRAVEGK